MIIKKKETIEFSVEELRCFEMTMTLLEGIINHGHDPHLVENADTAWEALSNIYSNHVETEEAL